MKYKITNRLLDTESGKRFEVNATFNSFETVADKVVRDLNSLWKGSVPFPFEMRIEVVGDDAKLGTELIEGDEVIASNDKYNDDMLEIYSSKINEHFGKTYLKGDKQ
jgi:hypothetical protein